MYIKVLNRLQKLHELIERGNTGSPSELAKKMYISESQLYVCLQAMKKLNVPVQFCRRRNSYYYHNPGTFFVGFIPPPTDM